MITRKRETPTWPLQEDDPTFVYLQHILTLSPRGLCTDIDGTISLTAPTVDAAVLLPGMRKLLTEATQQFDLVATISGRAITDQRRMIGIPEVYHVGHHGYEWEEIDEVRRQIILYPGVEPYIVRVADALDEIEAELAPQIPGLWMERKGITGGIHWRLAEDHERAEQIAIPAIHRIAKAHGLRSRGSKLAVEIYPPILTNKGEGLHRLVKMHHLASVIYLGDDVSDADAFQEIHRSRRKGLYDGIAIAVTNDHSRTELLTHADLWLPSPHVVREFFGWLLTIK